MRIRLSRIHFPVRVLGFGARIGIWVQGCSIGCKGCCSIDTWGVDGGVVVPVADVVAACRELSGERLDGITISGGEPFEQPEPLEAMLGSLRAWTKGLARPIDYLCYSGMSLRRITGRWPSIVGHLDALVAGPYIESRGTAPLRGSSNKKMSLLTDLGRQRYAHVEQDCGEAMAKIQVQIDKKHIWMIGIPSPGDLDRLTNLCAERGLDLGAVSWKA